MLFLLGFGLCKEQCYRRYTVSHGVETFKTVSLETGVPEKDIINANPNITYNYLNPGLSLLIPYKCDPRSDEIYNDNYLLTDPMFAANGSLTLSLAYIGQFRKHRIEKVINIWSEAKKDGIVDEYGYSEVVDTYANRFGLNLDTECSLFNLLLKNSYHIYEWLNIKENKVVYTVGNSLIGLHFDPTRNFNSNNHVMLDSHCFIIAKNSKH